MAVQKQWKTIFVISLLKISLFTLKQASAESNAEDFIKKSCKESQYPDLCYSSLSQFADQVKDSSEKLAAVSITYCLSKVQPVKAHIQDLSGKAKEPKLSQALKQCVENFGSSVDNINDSIKQMKDSRAPGAISNLKTWMSAALTYENTCLDAMKDVPDGSGKKDVINQTDGVTKINSISLTMINLFAKS